MKTDTSEKGLESLIMRHMAGTDGLAAGAAGAVADAAPAKGGSGWCAGRPAAYDREFAVDSEQLFTFSISRTEREIALMQEYRTRLTADIVTGKLDVREAAQLPDIPIWPVTEPVAAALDGDEDLDVTEPEES